MKWLVALGLFVSATTFAQTASIDDRGESVKFFYTNTADTIYVPKSMPVIMKVKFWDKVWVVNGYTDKAIAKLDYSDFGYSTGDSLAMFLDALFTSNYDSVHYDYTGGNMDTVSYSWGGTVQYKEVYKYGEGSIGADTLTSKKIVLQ